MLIRRLLCAALAAASLFALTACGKTDEPVVTTSATTVTTTATETTTTATETETTTTTEATTAAPAIPQIDSTTLPRTVYGGAWSTSHVQGIAIDTERQYMYFSFTTVLVKTDMSGKIVGTVENLVGHLGDLDYNEEDGRIYGSLEFKNTNTFYIAIFDADKIDRVGLNGTKGDVMSVVAMPDVTADFTANVDGKQYRYGCSGIDGVAFGPAPGAPEGSPSQLMVAYGIFRDDARTDNDYQVLLQFDWRQWAAHEKPFKIGGTDTDGPTADERYFVYTGNTNYGVQNLEYDPASKLWLMAVYVGNKPGFPNYSLFAVDGTVAPVEGEILGQPTAERGLLLTLADMGLTHKTTGLRGWYFGYGDTGMIALGDGYFYLSHDGTKDGKQTCTATLYRFTGDARGFEAVK